MLSHTHYVNLKLALLEDFVTSGRTIRLLELWTSIFQACLLALSVINYA